MATKKLTGNISAKKIKDHPSVLPTENQPIPIWPEWSDQDINTEKWDITSTAKTRDKSRSIQSPVYFVDPEGSFVLPPSLKPAFTKRPNQFINSKVPVVFDSNSVNVVDLFYNNQHLFRNETLKWIICDIQNLWLHYQARTDTTQTKQGFDERVFHKWRPWEHIYALNKVGREPSAPQYNSYGKYIVKLYWMGCWRKITVDDVVPFDGDKKMLLPQSRLPHELWPMLLTKALLKIASLSFCTGDSFRKEFGDFSAVHALTGWLRQTIYIRKQDSDSSWNSLKSYLIEWKRPEDRTVTDVRRDEDMVEENSKKDLEKGVKPATQVKEKRLVEKKHESGRELQGSARTTPTENEAYIRPERVIFASLKSPVLETRPQSLNYCEESLGQLGVAYTDSYPVCLTAVRTIPLKLPPEPKPVPAWKLIRPRPADFPLSEEQKPSDDVEEKEPIRSVLASSAFVGSTIFRQSPESSINSLKHPGPNEVPREMSSLSQENPNKSCYGSTKTDENVVSKPEKNDSVLSDTKKPRRGQSLLNKPDLRRVSRTGTLSAKSQQNKEPLNEEVQPTEQELGPESNTEVPNSALQLKEFWLNMDQMCDLFETIDVYHKPHTYPVKKTYENMIAAGTHTDRSPINGLYLFVDSIHPSEAIIGLSTICQWPPPLLKSTERTSSEIEVEAKNSATVEKKDDGAIALERSDSNWTQNQNASTDLDHSFATVNPPQARLIVEKVCCSRLSGNPVKCLDINAHRAISLNLPPGRHCFSLIVCSPLGYRVTVLGSPVVTFSPASHVTPVLLEKTSESLGPAVSSLEKSPRLSKLNKPRQRQASPALITETLLQAYQMELCDEDRFFNSCLTRVPTRVRNRAHAIVAGLLNLGRIYTSLYNEEQWPTILTRADSIEQVPSSKDSSGTLSEQQAHWLLQQYASRRKELESLILTNVPDKAVSLENPIGSKAFRRSLLAILQQLCCSSETGESLATPEMNLAWRVLQWDWTTDNPFYVTYKTPRGPTPTSRSKGRLRSALGEKQAQSIKKEGSEEEFQIRWSQPIDPDTLIAVVRIQAAFRGYHTRLCMRLRSPQTIVSFLVPSLRSNSLSDSPLGDCDTSSYVRMKMALMRKAKRVESGWSKCLELLNRGQTEREIGVDLVQMLVEQNELEFGRDLERYIACLDFTGSQPSRPVSDTLNLTEECTAKPELSPKVQDWVTLLFRDILTIGPQNDPKDGGSTKDFRMRFRTDLPDCQIKIINNDTGQELYTIFTGTVHPTSLKLNENGYSLLGIGGPSPSPEGRWLLRLMAPGTNGLNGLPQIQNDWQRPLCTAFKAKEVTGYYVPNEKALLFRRHVEVDRDQLITVHLRLSAPSVPVRLSIFHSNQLVTAATGVGEVCVRAQLLRSTKDLPISQPRSLTKEDQSDSSSTGRRPSAKKTGRVSRQSSTGSSGRKSRESSISSTSQPKRMSSREGHPLSGDRRSHVHPCWIEAHVDRNAWPLSLENWSFLVEQKKAQLEEFLARRQRGTPPRQRTTTTTTATKSSKEKQTMLPSEIDERQAHWKMRIILDANKLNEVRILPEENIAERVRAMKAAWEELEPGRAKRAALSRDKYLRAIAINMETSNVEKTLLQSFDPVGKDVILTEDLPVEPVTQTCGEGFDSKTRYTLDPPPSLSNTPSESFRLEKARLAETLGHIEQQRLEEAVKLLRLLDESSFIGTHYLKALNEEEITSDPSESVTLKQKVYNEFQKACDEAKECLKVEKTKERDMFILLMKTLQLLNDKSRAAYFESCEALRCKLLDSYRKEQEILKGQESVLDQPDSRTSSGRQRRKQRDSGKRSRRRNP